MCPWKVCAPKFLPHLQESESHLSYNYSNSCKLQDTYFDHNQGMNSGAGKATCQQIGPRLENTPESWKSKGRHGSRIPKDYFLKMDEVVTLTELNNLFANASWNLQCVSKCEWNQLEEGSQRGKSCWRIFILRPWPRELFFLDTCCQSWSFIFKVARQGK